MSKLRRPLAEAEQIASAIMGDLAPSCQRVAVAGSVRRREAEVGDLEIVAVPALLPAGLFGDEQENALYAHLHARSGRYRFVKGDHPGGTYYQLLLRDEGMQLDLFTAQADNFGLILLIRTGSAAFSQAALTQWKRVQGIGPEQAGSRNGYLVTKEGGVVATPEEQDVFDAMKMPFLAPERRSTLLDRPPLRVFWSRDGMTPDQGT
jgi:DNA polymerase/3'-5' exonuclease PolX